MSFYDYTLASKRNGTLYTRMTDDLIKRVWQHRTGVIDGFAKDHNVKMIVWFEAHETRESTLTRERQIKKWNRVWKLELIEKANAGWRDLWDEVTK